jgi:hypothetical protein
MCSSDVGSFYYQGGVNVGTFISCDKRIDDIRSISGGGVPKIGFDINGRS